MSTGFSSADRQAVLFREGWVCAMGCGNRANVVNHRANRGAGGHRASNRLANACALCHACNDRIESDAVAARKARELGVKLSRYDDPEQVPFYSPMFGEWVHLHDDGLTFDVDPDEVDDHLRSLHEEAPRVTSAGG